MSEPACRPALRVDPEALIGLAVDAVQRGQGLEASVGGADLPLYLTDARGFLIFFNHACREFAGRDPRLGEDQWCVTWRLETEGGDPLPHDQCPLALAIREGKPIRGVIAVAVRPDGSRVRFRPLPTPILDEEGRPVGAVNVLVQLADPRGAALKAQALRCRRLAASMTDARTIDTLVLMADEYDRAANVLESASSGTGAH